MALKDTLRSKPVLGTAIAVQERTKGDAADQFGAAIAFFAFLSLFPIIALVVAVGSFFLAGDAARLQQLVDGIQQAIPGLGGDTIGAAIDTVIDNAGTIGIVGLLGVLFSGLRIAKAAQTSTRFVFRMPLVNASPLKARAWQLASLVILGILLVASVAASSYAQVLVRAGLPGVLDTLAPLGTFLVGALLDVGLFWVAYRVYSIGSDMSWRELLPGAILGGIGWTLLKYFGGSYLSSQASGSVVSGEGDGGSAAMLMLATVIGLLALFYLAGRLYVYGAELSAELAGLPAPEGADAEAGAGADGEREPRRDDAPAREAERSRQPDDQPTHDAPTDGDDVERSGDRSGLFAALSAQRARASGRGEDDRERASSTGGGDATAGPAAGRLDDARRGGRRGSRARPAATAPLRTSAPPVQERVPWELEDTSVLDDTRVRQVMAFASSAVAVVAAGLVGRR